MAAITQLNPEKSILLVNNYGVAFGNKVILSDINIRLSEQGVFVLMGPGGTGKSTLLRSISGLNDANPGFHSWGSVEFIGDQLGDGNRPSMVAQSAKLMMHTVQENIVSNLPERSNLTAVQQKDLVVRLLEFAGLHELKDALQENVVNLPLATQRHLAILRLTVAGPRLVFIDEPTAGLDDESSERLLNFIKKESGRRSILVVLHNQNQAMNLGGHTALLAGGRIQELQETSSFFQNPLSDPARQFVKLGSCNLPSPGASVDELAEDIQPPAPLPADARIVPSESFGPRGFLWLKRGRLAGTPLPGVVHDIDYDMKALKRMGVSCLVSLTTKPVDPVVLNEYEITGLWYPIKDMEAPDMEQAMDICRDIEQAMRDEMVVAVHCRAGLGRTGTILAAMLIWEGIDALTALDKVRGVEPRWVQSEIQVKFLQDFANAVAEVSKNPQTMITND